jgi:two-component system, response regulator PdtaR
MNTQDRPITVVVAEDEALLRIIAVSALADEGFETFEARHADDVLAICATQAEKIDVLFIDIQMPGTMNGLELARHVRTQWPWIAILIASGNTFPETGALPAGSRFLAKPYDLNDIASRVHEVAASR